MDRTWVDPRDKREWRVKGAYVAQAKRPGEPIAMMGPDIPVHVWFHGEHEVYSTIVKLSEPLESLPDEGMAALLDSARGDQVGNDDR